MRILLIGPSLFMPWTTYTVRALKRLGHSVAVYHETDLLLERLASPKGRELSSHLPGLTSRLDEWRSRWFAARDKKLLQAAHTLRPDLILILWGRTFSADLLKELKSRAGCPLATWWLDDPFREPMEGRLSLYDIFFVFDRSYMPRLMREGARKVQFLPCACDETVYRPLRLNPLERRRLSSEIAFVAWYYPKRAQVVQSLRELGLKIWGRGWTSPEARQLLNGAGPMVRGERFITDRTTAKIYNATKIGLNVHSEQTHEAGLNTRSFELLATGAFELVDGVPGMEELLEPGKEVAVFRSPEEARTLAAYYLGHPQKRASMAGRGQARVLREHTYVHRMRKLLSVL